jgi:Tfp pilus assembly protein PilX
LYVYEGFKMRLHQTGFALLRKQSGAFLVIAVILIIVLSALGIASMSETVYSLRTSRNYSKYMEAKAQATSMAEYGKKILASYPDGKYPGPATCTTTGTCNVINNAFPHNGRPTLVWSSGLGTAKLNENSESDAWWTSHGFAYENAFSGSSNARVIVQLIGTESASPYRNTYKIVGYATDSTGTVRATSTLYHQWYGYRTDPYPSYPDTPFNGCTSGCPYGQCCSSSGTCAATQAACEANLGTYTPPGWYCSDYYGPGGLGYTVNSTCLNPLSKILDAIPTIQSLSTQITTYYQTNGSWPASVVFNGVTITADTNARVKLYNIMNIRYHAYPAMGTMMVMASLSGLTGISGYVAPTTVSNDGTASTFRYLVKNNSGVFTSYCGIWPDAVDIPLTYQPPYCQCSNLSQIYNGGAIPGGC